MKRRDLEENFDNREKETLKTHDTATWQHDHIFGLDRHQAGEKRTHWVIGLTIVTMIVELVAGYLTGSMALTADGWHMSTHAAALSISAFAYAFARRNAGNPRFTFGTGKVGPLGGFASAVALAIVALLMAAESLHRLAEPVPVRFREAILVAVIGLIVNVVSAWLLRAQDHHHHGHEHGHHHGHDDHRDHNLQAAYLHVLADALTSLTAIVALTCGMFLGWVWMDPLMGVVGSVIIAIWARGLLKDTAKVLLDAEENQSRKRRIRELLSEEKGLEIVDLHLWRVGSTKLGCIISLVTHNPQPSEHYKRLLETMPELAHLTVEINHCRVCPK